MLSAFIIVSWLHASADTNVNERIGFSGRTSVKYHGGGDSGGEGGGDGGDGGGDGGENGGKDGGGGEGGT